MCMGGRQGEARHDETFGVCVLIIHEGKTIGIDERETTFQQIYTKIKVVQFRFFS